MADVNLSIGAEDGGALRLLQQILSELQNQRRALEQSTRATRQARDAKGRFVKASKDTREALRREAAQTKQTAAAQLQANREVARALQQRTQAELAALRAETQRSRAGLAAAQQAAAERERAHQREQATFREGQQLAREKAALRQQEIRAELAALRVAQQRAVEQARADRETARATLERAKAAQRAADLSIQASKAEGVQARIAAQDRRLAVQREIADARARTQAANNAARAARQQVSIRHQQEMAERRLQAAQARTRQQARSSTVAIGGNTNALRMYVGQVIRYAVAIQGVRLFAGFVREGLMFNEVLETAALGIASIMTATSDIYEPVSGRLVDGAEALQVAMAGATDQVQKLRIAGLQTAATTDELVEAYQSAVAAGVAAGLNLDEIRDVTVQIVQAAGAIGLPMQQLEQEVRSILDATIDRNSRVARVLGITNEQVRLAKEQNRLADYLNERLESFNIAGQRAMNTFRVMRSNLAEALQVFAGASVEPLFEQLAEAGQRALSRVFDFDESRISEQFEGLVRGLQESFRNIGEFLVAGIERSLDGLESLGRWMQENRVTAAYTADAFFAMVASIGQVAADVGMLVAGLIRAGVESGALAAAFDVVRQTMEFLSGTPIITAVALAALSKAVSLVTALATGIRTVFLLTSGPGAVAMLTNPWTAAALAVGLLVGGIVTLVARSGQARREIARMGQELIQEARDVGQAGRRLSELGVQYEQLRDRLSSLEEGSDEYQDTQRRMNGLYEEMLRINPEIALALEKERAGREDATEAIWKQIAAQRTLLALQLEDSAERYNTVHRLLANEEERLEKRNRLLKEGGSFSFVVDGMGEESKRAKELQEQLRVTGDELLEVTRQIQAMDDATALRDIGTFVGRVGDPDEGGSSSSYISDLKRRAEAQISVLRDGLASLKQDLEQALEENAISYTAYFSQISAAEEQFARAAVGIYQELSRNIPDEGEKEQIQAKIVGITTGAASQVKKNNLDMRNSYRDLFRELEGLDIQLLEEQGRTAEALMMQLDLQYRDLIARLRAEGLEESAGVTEQIFNFRRARVLLSELEDAVSESRTRMQGELSQIEAQVITGVTREWDARDRVVEVYGRHLNHLMQLRDAQLALAVEGVEGSDMAREAVEKLDQEIIKAAISYREAERAANQLLFSSQEAVRSDLAQWMSDGIDNALSLADAFRILAESVVNSIRRIVSEMLATRITDYLFSLAEAGTSAGSGGGAAGLVRAGAKVAGMAEGGFVSGRGTSTSDSIPALLSNGEYVLRASAVRSVGIDLLNEINFGSRTPAVARRGMGVRRFAEGGAVVANGGATGGFSAELGLAPGLVIDSLKTRDGTRAMVNLIGGNRRAIRAALGLG